MQRFLQRFFIDHAQSTAHQLTESQSCFHFFEKMISFRLSRLFLSKSNRFKTSFQHLCTSVHNCQQSDSEFQEKLNTGPSLQHFILQSDNRLEPFIMKWGKNLNEPYIDQKNLDGQNAKGMCLFLKFLFFYNLRILSISLHQDLWMSDERQ